jgi:hypothetical protein
MATTQPQDTAVSAKNAYAPNNARAKFKSIISEMRRKKEDPNFIRYVMDQEGYDVSMVDQELANLASYETGQPIQSKPMDTNAIPGDKIDQTQLTAAQSTALLYGQRMFQSGKILDAQDETIANKGLMGSIGQKIDEMNVGGTVTGQFVGEDFKKYDQAKRDFINASLRRESGAVISPEEFKNAEMQYFPKPGDSADVLAQKKANRETQAKGFLKSAGVTDAEINFNSSSSTTTPVTLNSPEEATKWLQENPTDPRADRVREKLASVGVTVEQTAPQSDMLNVSDGQGGQATDAITEGGKVGEALGSFFGGNKIGAAIGHVIGGFMAKHGEAGKIMQDNLASLTQLKADGKITEEKYNALVDTLNQTAKDAFGYTGPNFKQVAGDVIKAGSNVLGGAEVAGAKVLGVAGRSALVGGVSLAGNAMAENKDIKGIAKDAAIGAVTTGLLAGTIKGISNLRKIGATDVAKAVGQIVQGKTKDITPAMNVLSRVNTSGVKDYTGLKSVIGHNTKALGLTMDEILSKDTTPRLIGDLTVTAKVGDSVVKTNYVEQALNHLDELYTKTNDPIDAQKIKNIIEKANSTGLTTKEINDVAKRYGTEFGKKAFGKTGEALTSVNAQAFENTRSGVKTALRGLLPDDTARKIDSMLSDNLNTQQLVDKMVEKVSALNQKIGKRGLIEKVGGAVGKGADLLTGHGLRGIAGGLFPSNVGLKTMNSLDLQKALEKNLSVIDEALNAKTSGALTDALKKFNRGAVSKISKMRVGLTTQEVNAKDLQFRETYKRLSQSWDKAKSATTRKQIEKSIQSLIDNNPVKK